MKKIWISPSSGAAMTSNVGEIKAKLELNGTSKNPSCMTAGLLKLNQLKAITLRALIHISIPTDNKRTDKPSINTETLIRNGTTSMDSLCAPSNPIPNALTNVARAIAAVKAMPIPAPINVNFPTRLFKLNPWKIV